MTTPHGFAAAFPKGTRRGATLDITKTKHTLTTTFPLSLLCLGQTFVDIWHVKFLIFCDWPSLLTQIYFALISAHNRWKPHFRWKPIKLLMLVSSYLKYSMYDIFSNLDNFYGRCRKIYHTLSVWVCFRLNTPLHRFFSVRKSRKLTVSAQNHSAKWRVISNVHKKGGQYWCTVQYHLTKRHGHDK